MPSTVEHRNRFGLGEIWRYRRRERLEILQVAIEKWAPFRGLIIRWSLVQVQVGPPDFLRNSSENPSDSIAWRPINGLLAGWGNGLSIRCSGLFLPRREWRMAHIADAEIQKFPDLVPIHNSEQFARSVWSLKSNSSESNQPCRDTMRRNLWTQYL
jgi:hypothetical protein